MMPYLLFGRFYFFFISFLSRSPPHFTCLSKWLECQICCLALPLISYLGRAIVPIAAFTTSLSYWSDPINTHRERQAKFVKSNLRSPLPVVVFEEIANVCQAPLKSKHRHLFYRISSFIFMSVQRKKTRETISICHYTYRYLRRLVKAQGKVFVFLAIRFLSPDIFLSYFYLIFISLSLFRYPFSDLKKRHYQIRFFTSVLRPSIVF